MARPRPLSERIAHAEAESARHLGNANEHSEAGRHRAAVRSHDAAQRWLDEANRLRGWGDGTERKVHQPSPGPFGGPLAGARRRPH